MSQITLSYVTSTKNKLPFLRDRMKKLLAEKKDDEEILVADGGSTDGTKEYLQELKNANRISFFISEPDYGESHALNKLFLVANGTLVTLITDDDVFSFPSIQKCKSFMLDHSSIDMLGTNGGFKNQKTSDNVRPLDYTGMFQKWQKSHTPFSFCGLGIMFRRESLPVLGLWNLSFRRADMEYALRVTSGPAHIAWYTGYTFVNVSNPQSVSLVYSKKIKNETDRLNRFYLHKKPNPFFIEKLFILKNKIRAGTFFSQKNTSPSYQTNWNSLILNSEDWLKKMETNSACEFMWDSSYENR